MARKYSTELGKSNSSALCNLEKILVGIFEQQYVPFFQPKNFENVLTTHTPPNFLGLCSMKSSSKTLKNLPYFMHMKTQSCFFHFSFRATLYFFQMGFRIGIQNMANFEAFCWNFSSSTNPQIVRSELLLLPILQFTQFTSSFQIH